MLGRIYGNKMVNLWGFQEFGDRITDGVILVNGMPVYVVGYIGYNGNYDELHVSFKKNNLPKAVFSKNGNLTQRPYWETIGYIADRKLNDSDIKLSSVAKIDKTIANMVSSELTQVFATKMELGRMSDDMIAAIAMKQNKMQGTSYLPTYHSPYKPAISGTSLNVSVYGDRISRIGGYFSYSAMSNRAVCSFGVMLAPDSDIYIPAYGIEQGKSPSSNMIYIGDMVLKPTGELFISSVFSSYDYTHGTYVNPTTYYRFGL